VAAINGVPWWYLSDVNDGRYLKTLDPDGTASHALDSSRLVGCVVHLSAEVAAPGVVRHTAGNRLILGEVRETQPTSLLSAVGLVELFNAAGFAAEHSDDIRTDVWTKLIGNLSFNPVSALTGLRMDRLCADPAICDLLRALIEEGKAVAAAMGIPLTIDADARIAMARALGPVRTSTLQDFDAGRRPELDALVGAVIELAQWHQVPVPALRHVHALAQGRAHALGLLSA
jgi:2-dehydropantoate 2-reductase